jgi:hypothetical protein
MKTILATALSLALILPAAAALAQEKAKGPEKAPPAAEQEMKAAMEAMEKAATPGAMHQFLAKMAGTWNVESKAWMGPGDPMISKGTSVCTMVLGGRFLQEEVKADFGGMPYEGKGITGYDNVAKVFQATWVDTLGTGLGVATGSLDPTGKILTSTMTFTDPRTGKEGSMRTVLTLVDEKTHRFEVFERGPDGKEVRTMEMTYRKA